MLESDLPPLTEVVPEKSKLPPHDPKAGIIPFVPDPDSIPGHRWRVLPRTLPWLKRIIWTSCIVSVGSMSFLAWSVLSRPSPLLMVVYPSGLVLCAPQPAIKHPEGLRRPRTPAQEALCQRLDNRQRLRLVVVKKDQEDASSTPSPGVESTSPTAREVGPPPSPSEGDS